MFAFVFQEEGLRVLILDKNYLSDIGLRQLTRVLKHDFWLKTLCLRCCGITKRGGEIVFELLQINSVLTQIDLRDNELSLDILQIIRKILKKRKSKGERISMKKRLLNHKQIFVSDMILKDKSQHISKGNKFLEAQAVSYLNLILKLSARLDFLAFIWSFYINIFFFLFQHTQTKTQKNCILQIQQTTRVRKMRRKGGRKCRSHGVIKAHINWSNVDELKNQLSLLISHNQNLIKTLENNTNFLLEERDRRLSVEEAYHKMQPRLRNLRNKIIIQNSIHSNTRYENQIYTNLQNVFNNFKIFTNGKVLRMDEKS